MVKICKKLGGFWENVSNPVTPGSQERANQIHTEKYRLLCKQQGTPQALLLKRRTQSSTNWSTLPTSIICFGILNNSTGLLLGKHSHYTVHRYGKVEVSPVC